jgi:hypothetical protein
MRKFCGEILDPADGIAVFEKRFDEQHIGAMLSNEFIRLLESVCRAANMVPRVAANDCDQALLANDGIADRYDPARLCTRASRRTFFLHFASLANRGLFKGVKFMKNSWESYRTFVALMISRRGV